MRGLAIAIGCGWHGFRARNPACLLFWNYSPPRVSIHSSTTPSPASFQERARSTLRFLAIFFVALTFSHVAIAAVGAVSKVENQAQVGGTAAVVGTPVQTNDQLRTGPKSRLEVTFADDTKLTLGENAQVVVDHYVFNPDQSKGELVLSSSAAAFRLATGKLNEMSDRKVNVSTPFGALAVRGTDFWWGKVDGRHGVLLVNSSRVDVGEDKCPENDDSNDNDHKRCRCKVTLDQPGEGTFIKRGCPEAPFIWPPGLQAAALASTSFGLAWGPGVLAPAAAVAGVLGAFIGSTAGNSDNGGGSQPQH